MSASTTASKRQFSVSVAPYPGTVDYMSGGAEQQPTSKYYNGGAGSPDIIKGRRVVDNVVVRKRYTPLAGNEYVKGLRKLQKANQTFTITKQPLDENGTAVGRPEVLTGCKIVRITKPDYDEQSDSDAAIIEVEYSVADVK